MAIVAQLDKQLAAIKADAADAEDAVAKVLKQLELVGGEPMRQQRDLVDSLKLVCFEAPAPASLSHESCPDRHEA